MAASMDGNLLGHLQDVQARRRAALRKTIQRMQCDRYQCLLLLNLELCADGSGWVEISVDDMAKDRSWLGCSRGRAYAAVSWALAEDLVQTRRSIEVESGDRRERVWYSLRWDAIEDIAASGRREKDPPVQSAIRTPVRNTDSSPQYGLQSVIRTAQPAAPAPYGDTPRTHTRATGTATVLPSSSSVESETLPAIVEASGEAIALAAREKVIDRLFSRRLSRGHTIAAKNDQRAVYQLAQAWCDPEHRPWIEQLLDEVSEAEKPLGLLWTVIEDFCPGARRALKRIHVPDWAHADPRSWLRPPALGPPDAPQPVPEASATPSTWEPISPIARRGYQLTSDH